MNWETVSLGDACHVIAGGTPKRSQPAFWGGGIPWVKISDMLQGTISSTEETISEEGLDNSSAKLLPKGTLLISIFATIGRTAILGCEATTNQAIVGVVPKDASTFDGRFLLQCLNHKARNLEQQARGVAQANINGSVLKALELPLPPLPEQKRIAAILDAADALRAKRRESIGQLDSLVQATFLEMFGDPVTNDHRWDLVSLGEHASKVGSGATPKGGDAAYKREGITLIRSQNVHDSDFRLEGLAFIDDAQATKLANVEVAENDVLLNITGASVARVCRAPRYVLPARVNQHVCIIRTKPTLNAYFLEKLLMSPSMKRTLLGIGEAGATRQAITKSEVLRLALPLPPVELQARFASFVQLVESQKDRLNRHLAQLEMLFVSLQSRAFSGELCSSSFSRQPASA